MFGRATIRLGIGPHSSYYIRFNGLFSRTTWVSWHQGKPFWILSEQEMMGWQWHQLDHMQIICTSLQKQRNLSRCHLGAYSCGPMNHGGEQWIQLKLQLYQLKDSSSTYSAYICNSAYPFTHCWCTSVTLNFPPIKKIPLQCGLSSKFSNHLL